MSFISGLRFSMPHRFSRPLSIYKYFLAAFSVVVLLMTLLLVNSLYERQQQQGKATLDTVKSYSRIIAADTFRMLSDSREILHHLTERPAIQQFNETGCDPVFGDAIKLFPRFSNLVILDVDGNLVCSAIEKTESPLLSSEYSDAYVGTRKTNQFYLGSPKTKQFSDKFLLNMAQPIKDGDGRFVGLIGFALDLHSYRLLPEYMQLPEGISVAAISGADVVIARSQNSAERIGMPFSDAAALSHPDQSIDMFGLPGGANERVLVSTRVGDTDWRIVSTQDRRYLLHAQRLLMVKLGFLVLFFVVTGLILARFFARRIAAPLLQMAHDAALIAAGNWDVRLTPQGPKELSEVANQFNLALESHERANAALQANEHRFRSLVEWSPECIGIHRGGKIVYLNPALLALFGARTEQELVGTPIMDRIHPDFHHIVSERIRAFNENGENVSLLAEKFIKLDGAVIDVEVQSMSIMYEGEPAFYTNIRDISQSKKDLIALSESEYRWKFAIEGAGDGLWDWDITTGKVFFSKRLKEMFGFTETDFSNELSDWERRIHPDDAAHTWAAMRAHLDGVTPVYQSEHRVRCKEGNWKWIFDRGLVVSRNENGFALRMIGTHSDVNDRVEKNLLVQTSFDKIRNLELALDEHAIVAITDSHGTITYANEKFCSISQYRRDELLGQDHSLLNSGHHTKAFIRDMWRTIVKGQVWKGEIMNRARDGSLYWVDTTIVPFLNAEGKVLQYFAIRRDITEQKNMVLAMRHNSDQLRALAAYQSRVKEDERKRIAREIHDDLGGTLSGIKSYLSVLIGRAQRQDAGPDPILIDASTMTDQAIDSVRRLINELRPSVLDQLGIWVALESHAAHIAQRSTLACECVIDASLDEVELGADASTATFRIVQELITNVLRHAAASKVTIRAKYSDSWITVEVEDDGKGISASEQTGGKSWGIIGMYERAQQCNGTLVIKNMATQDAQRHGTLAVLRLPLEQADAKS